MIDGAVPVRDISAIFLSSPPLFAGRNGFGRRPELVGRKENIMRLRRPGTTSLGFYQTVSHLPTVSLLKKPFRRSPAGHFRISTRSNVHARLLRTLRRAMSAEAAGGYSFAADTFIFFSKKNCLRPASVPRRIRPDVSPPSDLYTRRLGGRNFCSLVRRSPNALRSDRNSTPPPERVFSFLFSI